MDVLGHRIGPIIRGQESKRKMSSAKSKESSRERRTLVNKALCCSSILLGIWE